MDEVIAQTIFCDDIRMEVSGKFLIIGVYSDGLGVVSTPCVVGLSTWTTITGLPVGTHSIGVYVVFYENNGAVNEAGSTSFEVEVTHLDAPIALRALNLQFNAPATGSLRVHITVNDGSRIKAGLLPLVVQVDS